MSWKKQSRQENLIYLTVWGLLFAAPLLSLYIRTVSDADATFNWTEVFTVWRMFAIYLVLFLVHNFLLAPLLVHQRNRVAYFSIVLVLLSAFAVLQCSQRPDRRDQRPPMERIGHHQPPHFDGHSKDDARPMMNDDNRPMMNDEARPVMNGDEPPMKPDDMRPPREPRHADAEPLFIGMQDILSVVVLVLMFGANLGIKNYFRSRDDRKRLAELQRENLEQQLEYLRYQINPHFFMNTLNNIHALVDIDPEQAKDTILELSKMMRYVLYEGNKQGVRISDELDFIRHYVALMQLRYTDKVRISVDLPQEVPDRQIPPLILVTFIENAFKHGVSYQHESFIEVTVAVEDETLCFICRNSKAEDKKAGGQQGGVGLANIRKRLNLIYDKQYSLKIKSEPDTYTVELVIPLKS